MKFTHTQALESLNKLPQETRERVTSQEITDATIRIAERNVVPKEKILAFSSAVGTVLLGLIQKEKLAEQLVAELQLPPEKAAAIAGEVEKEIFNSSPSAPFSKGKSPSPSKADEGVGVGHAQGIPLRPAPPVGEAGHLPSQRGEGEQKQISPPRPVPIRKPLPPLAPSLLGRAGGGVVPSLQSLLADIRRGTAYDENRIADAFRKTPIEVKQSLESVGFLSRMEGVAKKFGLNVEETGELVSESGLVMLGLTQPMNFVDNLTKRLRLPRDRAMAVGQAVNMEVLRPVREILRKMSVPSEELRFAPPATPAPSQNPPPTPSFSKGGGGGGGFSPVQKYTTDPYREPIN